LPSCLLSKNIKIGIYITNCIYCIIWVWNLVSCIKGRTWAKSFQKQRAEKDTWV
jgi:hypothetical protein